MLGAALLLAGLYIARRRAAPEPAAPLSGAEKARLAKLLNE
jgi:hypothetical protein